MGMKILFNVYEKMEVNGLNIFIRVNTLGLPGFVEVFF